MRNRSFISTFMLILILSGAWSPYATGSVHVVFMEPIAQPSEESGMPLYKTVVDPDRVQKFNSWMNNEAADRALKLYGMALDVARETGKGKELPDALHIALVPDGNHADVGFSLLEAEETLSFPNVPYIKLGPRDYRFNITLLHETGHAVLTVLTGVTKIPKRRIASLPHTTAALTDRGTAFDEGFAIHLETLTVHLGREQAVRNKYRHEQILPGRAYGRMAEYYRHSNDLLTFAQTVSRYYDVRENNFAFICASREPDYFRSQMDKSRDFAGLRNANQLLQSEGFYASFFSHFLMRGRAVPDDELLQKRQSRMLRVLSTLLTEEDVDGETAYLPKYIECYGRLYPDLFDEVLDLFLDMTHGVFVDPQASTLWNKHYHAALELDMTQLNMNGIDNARKKWFDKGKEVSAALYTCVGPQIRCEVKGVEVELKALGDPAPLSFDINTAQEGLLRMIPGLGDEKARLWLAERRKKPFESVSDFHARLPLKDEVRSRLSFSS